VRVGTWNLAGRWSDAHETLLREQHCDVWLLTEVSDRMQLTDWNWSRSKAQLAPKRRWAAVMSTAPLECQDDPHPASAAAVIGGAYFCSSILPWRSCGASPWVGERHADKTGAAVATVTAAWPSQLPIVWGGDWNHALEGREYAGSLAGRRAVLAALGRHELQAPTAQLPHRLPPGLSIDHVAVPRTWTAAAKRVEASGLSDHDVYVAEVTRQ
jgi:hypothetical protein